MFKQRLAVSVQASHKLQRQGAKKDADGIWCGKCERAALSTVLVDSEDNPATLELGVVDAPSQTKRHLGGFTSFLAPAISRETSAFSARFSATLFALNLCQKDN